MKPAPRLLVSVRSRTEAELAYASGVSIIDFKEPDRGALGAVAPEILEDCISALPKTMLSVVLGEVGEGDFTAQASRLPEDAELAGRAGLHKDSELSRVRQTALGDLAGVRQVEGPEPIGGDKNTERMQGADVGSAASGRSVPEMLALTMGRGLGFLKLGIDLGDASRGIDLKDVSDGINAEGARQGISSGDGPQGIHLKDAPQQASGEVVAPPKRVPKVTTLHPMQSPTPSSAPSPTLSRSASPAAFLSPASMATSSALRLIEQACTLVAPAVAAGDRVIFVFYAEQALPTEALSLIAARGVHGVMLDTRKKNGPSLLGCRSIASLRAFVEAAQVAGLTVGLAGRLELADLPEICALTPDVVGMRGGLCRQSIRTGALAPDSVAAALAVLNTRISATEIQGG